MEGLFIYLFIFEEEDAMVFLKWMMPLIEMIAKGGS